MYSVANDSISMYEGKLADVELNFHENCSFTVDMVQVSKSTKKCLILGNDVLNTIGNISYRGLYVKDGKW
jgi:hypothetical protein